MVHTPKRPARRWWLIALTTGLTCVQIGALVRVAAVPAGLAAQISLILPLEFIAAAVWALIFALVTVNLIRIQAARPALWALLGFVTYSTARLLFFTRADYDQNRLPLLIIANLLVLPAVFTLRR